MISEEEYKELENEYFDDLERNGKLKRNKFDSAKCGDFNCNKCALSDEDGICISKPFKTIKKAKAQIDHLENYMKKQHKKDLKKRCPKSKMTNGSFLTDLGKKEQAITSISVQCAKDKGYNMYVHSEIEDAQWNQKPARIIINFDTYDNLCKWLESEHKEESKDESNEM